MQNVFARMGSLFKFEVVHKSGAQMVVVVYLSYQDGGVSCRPAQAPQAWVAVGVCGSGGVVKDWLWTKREQVEPADYVWCFFYLWLINVSLFVYCLHACREKLLTREGKGDVCESTEMCLHVCVNLCHRVWEAIKPLKVEIESEHQLTNPACPQTCSYSFFSLNILIKPISIFQIGLLSSHNHQPGRAQTQYASNQVMPLSNFFWPSLS